MSDIFPAISDYRKEKYNPQIQTYGHRIYKDQTLYEYLLEFLLVFSSRKGSSDYSSLEGTEFTLDITTDGTKLKYFTVPRMALKRFIFFERSDQEKRFDVDKNALAEHHQLLKARLDVDVSEYKEEFVINILQDLLYGFNAIIGNRSWFAQSVLPLAPELIFCESIGNKEARRKMVPYESLEKIEIDGNFNFSNHSFMARGGEVYYLHVTQGLQALKDSEIPYKKILEAELEKLVTNIPQLRKIATFIQNAWQEDEVDFEEQTVQTKKLEAIPASYEQCAKLTVEELYKLLTSELDPFEKIDLLGKLIPMQIIRMMSNRASNILNEEKTQEWLIDLTTNAKGPVRKKAVRSYEIFEEKIFSAVHQADIDTYMASLSKPKTKTQILSDAASDTNMLVRKLGKEIGLIIPLTGPNMRFSLNENLVKLLVVSLVKPGERILFTTFLKKCYMNFNLVIGPNEANKHFNEGLTYLDAFNENEQQLLQILRNCGFLRNLSDATSIVENPFK